MSNSVYYKATDEDGNTVLRHSWKKHKYLYIKNGKYVYPEDVKKSSVPYKGPTSAMQAQKAQHEKDFQKRVRAMNAHTVAKKNADMVRKKQEQQMKQIAANVKKQNAPSTKVKKAANFAKKVATRDAVAKTVAARYLLDKASKSPTANAAKAKARSVVSKGEYKLERAGQKLARDVKKTSAYKKARKATSTARSRAMTPAEARNKAEYKIERAGQKLANDAKPYATSVKKNVNKAYKSAKKEYNRVSRDASKAYKSAKKKAKKVSRSFNKAKRAGKAYLDYLTK
jgi:colicin import membrane protein